MQDKTIKNATKHTEWNYTGDVPNVVELKLSCLMRIADALEILTDKYERLESSRDWYRQRFEEKCGEVLDLVQFRAGYKAALTRLRNKTK